MHGARRRGRRARRWWRRCSPAPTGKSSAETTSTTCSRRSAPTGSGSDGTRPDRLHGRRQVERRPRTRRRLGRKRPGQRHACGGAPRPLDRGGVRARRRASFSAVEEEVVCELLADAGSGRWSSLGGGSVLSERVQRGAARAPTVLLDVDPASCWERVAGARVPGQRPLARRSGRLLRAAPGPPRHLRAARRRDRRRRCRAAELPRRREPAQAAPRRRRTRMLWARSSVGRISGVPRPRAAAATAARSPCGRSTAATRVPSW